MNPKRHLNRLPLGYALTVLGSSVLVAGLLAVILQADAIAMILTVSGVVVTGIGVMHIVVRSSYES